MGDAVPGLLRLHLRSMAFFFYHKFYGLHNDYDDYMCVFYIILLLFTNFVATGSKV